MATTTSATFARATHELRDTEVLLVHTLMNEGGCGTELQFRLGERPLAQLRATVGPRCAIPGAADGFSPVTTTAGRIS
jgi:urea transport system substrate-binding protein